MSSGRNNCDKPHCDECEPYGAAEGCLILISAILLGFAVGELTSGAWGVITFAAVVLFDVKGS